MLHEFNGLERLKIDECIRQSLCEIGLKRGNEKFFLFNYKN